MYAYISPTDMRAALESIRPPAGLHRTAPGVTEQLVDCSGGDVKDEETGFARKAEALTRVMGNEVSQAPPDPELIPIHADAEAMSHMHAREQVDRASQQHMLLYYTESCVLT